MDPKKVVREKYASVAESDGPCCESPCCTSPGQSHASAIGYSQDELALAPEGSNLGLGCGNPTALAKLKPGETVLDLGAGAGFDCFLAAARVGTQGKVIGVDMTQEMLQRARANAEKTGCGNVEFRLGEIEGLPVDDESVDVVISNCVINLVPDKRKAFQEAFRVLKPGGRLAVSDMVLVGELPDELKDSPEAYSCCISGAIPLQDYLDAIRSAGFENGRIVRQIDPGQVFGEGCCGANEDFLEGVSAEDLSSFITSVEVEAWKPG